MKVALVHDWLTGMRGGEKVLEALCEQYPDAEIFTLLHVRGSVSPPIERAPIHTSLLQHLPAVRRYYRECLPLFPVLVEQFDLERFDLVISSSHCVAKSIIPRPGAVHICYCHTPMRYAWDQFAAYFGPDRLGLIGSALARPVLAAIAGWDRATSARATRYVTNSQHVARRIRRYYNREASVVYPPVDTDFFHPTAHSTARLPVKDSSCLIVSALVPYKRVETAVDACRLERRAADSRADVTFLGRLSDEEVRDQYNYASLVLMPGEEDFGIVPLEAQACGRPVVALGRGGALETIVPDQTGVLVGDPTPGAFADAIQYALHRRFDRDAIRRHAEGFGRARFGKEIAAIVDETVRLGASRAW
jgi:glycosyltransferase involved in cell wall biosynthesis